MEENHAFFEGAGRQLKNQAQSADARVASRATEIVDQLCDRDDGRIAAMVAAGVDVQILSLNFPGVEQLEATQAIDLGRDVNERLAEAVHCHPRRFVGLATLTSAVPKVAVS